MQEKINKSSEYSYNELIYIKEGFYKGKYGEVDSYNDKTNTYTIRLHITKDDEKEKELIKIETNPLFIRHIKRYFGIFWKH